LENHFIGKKLASFVRKCSVVGTCRW